MLSVFGHALVLPLLLTATIAVRETPRFDDFDLFGFAGGEVFEAQVAQPKELVEEDLAPQAAATDEIVDLTESVEAEAFQEVAVLESAVTDVAPEASEVPAGHIVPEPAIVASNEATPVDADIANDTPLASLVADEPNPATVASQPALLQETIEPAQNAPAELASAPYPPAERLALTAQPIEPAEERIIQDVVDIVEPPAAEVPLELASLVMEEVRPANPRPKRLPARKSVTAAGETGTRGQQASLPMTAGDRRLAQSSPALWQVVKALRVQLARCWPAAEVMSGTPQFVDLEVAFDRSGRVKLARVQDAGRLLRDSGFSREARRARQALKACSPFALPTEHYGLWRHFTMRFMLSAPGA